MFLGGCDKKVNIRGKKKKLNPGAGFWMRGQLGDVVSGGQGQLKRNTLIRVVSYSALVQNKTAVGGPMEDLEGGN